MIKVDTKPIDTHGNKNIGVSEIQIRGSEEILYNDMIMLLHHIRNDKGLQRIFIDASAKVLSEPPHILHSEDMTHDKDK